MQKAEPQHYIVEAGALPPVFCKVLEAKALIETGQCKTVDAAAKKAGLSRSAFYKYRDSIRPFFEMRSGRIVTFAGILSDQAGILSKVLHLFADCGANILTIHQDLPTGGQAAVTVTARVGGMTLNLDSFVARVREINGILQFAPLAQQ